jgi:hypothetical protein
MGPSLTGVVAGFLLLAVLLWPLERVWPSVAGQRIRRRGFGTDVAYWFFTPLVTRVVTRLAVIVAVPSRWSAPPGPRARAPSWKT